MKPSDLHFKRFDTMRAMAALAGGTLVAIDDDFGGLSLVLSRDALCKSFSDLAEVERWLTAEKASIPGQASKYSTRGAA